MTGLTALGENRAEMARGQRLKIVRVRPSAGVEGGRVKIECRAFPVEEYDRCQVKFFGVPGMVRIATTSFVVAEIPSGAASGPITFEMGGESVDGVHFEVARRLAGDLRLIGNPVFDMEGNLLVTFSGGRDEQVPVTVFKLDPSGTVHPFIADVPNPGGIAVDADGEIYISSRYEGKVYRVTRKGELTTFAEGLGHPTGLAIGGAGSLYVGDRNGIIFRVDPSGSIQTFATVPAGVAATHLAFGPDELLYLSIPTFSTQDRVLRINTAGEVETFFAVLNYPQGLAFDEEGNLYVAAYLGGEGGVVKITPDGEASLKVSGAGLVGLAFDGHGGLVIAGGSAVYRLELGIKGLGPRARGA